MNSLGQLQLQTCGRWPLLRPRLSQHPMGRQIVCTAFQPSAGHEDVQQIITTEQSTSLPAGLGSGLSRLHQTPPAVWVLVSLQGIALIGALVGGTLARRRRFELAGLNKRLRQINAELRQKNAEQDLVCSAGEEEAVMTYRRALENAMGGTSAAHPYEFYGEGDLSLAQARQKLARTIREGRTALYEQLGESALKKANEARAMADELKDLRASRAVARLRATSLRQVGDLRGALRELEQSLSLSQELQDHSQDADVLGEIADAYADLGDYEQAAQVYDKCIVAIQDDTAPPPSSSWDC